MCNRIADFCLRVSLVFKRVVGRLCRVSKRTAFQGNVMATAPTSLSAAVAATASYTYSNWQRARRNERRQETSEAPLFTDTWITGQVEGMGPYAFLNTIAHANVQPGQLVRPAVVMRINHHWETVP